MKGIGLKGRSPGSKFLTLPPPRKFWTRYQEGIELKTRDKENEKRSCL